MPDSTHAARRLGVWAAIGCAVFSILYILAQLFEWAGALGSAGGPDSVSTSLGIGLLLTPSLLLGSSFVIMVACLHHTAPADRRVFSQAALAFATAYATLISLVYFTQLTLVGPRLATGDVEGIEFLIFVPYRSFLFAVDLLGYSFMSISTLLVAFALPVGRAARAARLFLLLNGLLLPFLALQMYVPVLIYPASLWAILFPAAAISVALLLRGRPEAAPPDF